MTPKRLTDTGLKRETYRAATAIECLVGVCCVPAAAAGLPDLSALLQCCLILFAHPPMGSCCVLCCSVATCTCLSPTACTR